MKITCLRSGIAGIMILAGIFGSCSRESKEFYYKFQNHSWNRFNTLTFNIPIQDTKTSYDIIFYASHTSDYEYDNLNFNMVMNTPDGEERIREYIFNLKKSGSFTGKCNSDSCEATIVLKSGMTFSKKGILKIEIEPLIPRVEIRGLLGVGVRLIPS